MPELQRVTAHHAAAILDFETENRAYFATSISDRGDAWFDHFEENHRVLLAEQREGLAAFHVLVGDDGEVVGRFNLRFVGDGAAELGYRVAQQEAGRGTATRTVRQLCRRAAAEYGISTIRAATSQANVASQRVLLKAGFVEVGPADPSDIGGKQGSWYERDLVASGP